MRLMDWRVFLTVFTEKQHWNPTGKQGRHPQFGEKTLSTCGFLRATRPLAVSAIFHLPSLRKHTFSVNQLVDH